MIGEMISHYHILEKIGEGGMGVIYKAEDTKLKREVALKFLPHHLTGNEEDRSRFRNEARAASALNHPNITTIYEIDEVGDHIFIAMEFLQGETLKDLIKGKKLTNRDIIEVGEAIAKALSEAHNLEIIHRDIKSENIMILRTGNVKIMDFGLAKRKGDNLITKKGVTMGTVAYMSPEQVEGKNIDFRTDIFSLGVILYEMAAGTIPFTGEHEASVLYSIVNEKPANIRSLNPDIHPELERIINQAMEKKPDNRYQSAVSLLNELDSLKQNLDSKQFLTRAIVPENVSNEIPVKNDNRSKGFLMGLAAVIIVASVAGFLFKDQLSGLLSFGSNNGVASALESNNENSLAVLYFDNLQDPDDSQRLGQILQELVIADLSEMSTLKVFSSRRLFDIQKQLGSDSRRLIDPDLATEIAQRAGASKMLTGKVMTVGDKTIITSQLIDTYDGSIIESQRVEGSDLYVLVDELVRQIQEELEVGRADQQVAEQSVREKTSGSVTAFQAYLEGMDHFNDSHFDLAIERFREAINLDSTFTRAYYELAISLWWFSSVEGGQEARTEAKNLIEKIEQNKNLSTKDRLLLNAAGLMIENKYEEAEEKYTQLVTLLPDEKDAWFGLGEAIFHGSHDLEKTLNAFEQVLKLDPGFSIAYRHIFDVYKEQGAITRGLVRANQYVSLNPNDQWGYIFTGDMLFERKNYQGAIEALETALSIDPDNTQALNLLAKISAADPDLTGSVIDIYEKTIRDNPQLEILYITLSNLYFKSGDLERGNKVMNDGLEKFPDNVKMIQHVARNHSEDGDLYAAIQLLDDKISATSSTNALLSLTQAKAGIYALNGKYSTGLSVLEQLQNSMPDLNENTNGDLEMTKSLWLSLGIGNYNKANEIVQNGIDNAKTPELKERFLYARSVFHYKSGNQKAFNDLLKEFEIPAIIKIMNNYYQAADLLSNKDLEKAEELISKFKYSEFFEFMLAYDFIVADINAGNLTRPEKYIEILSHRNNSLVDTIYYVRSFYLKGLLHLAKGENEKAITAFETLLEKWIDADPEIPELIDTYERLVVLRRPS